MSENQQPLVSVAITNYNYADYVGEAIESVLTQSYGNIELIVIDDGSTDHSLKVIKKYSDKIKLISRKNKGVVYTRNEAMRRASGEYFCFLDADDYFDTDYVARMYEVMRITTADVVYPNWHIVGERDEKIDFAEFDIGLLLTQQIHCKPESLVKLSAVKGHEYEVEKLAEDWDFFVGLALDGKKFQRAEGVYTNYRVRQNTRGSSKDTWWDDLPVFMEILEKWRKKYPDVVIPLNLPVAVGRARDEAIKEMRSVIDDQTRAIEDLNRSVKDKDVHIENLSSQIQYLNESLESIRTTKAYRVAKKVKAARRRLSSK